MRRKVKLPPLGEGADSAVVIEWACAVGETVAEGDTLMSVELDKLDLDVPSPVAGTVAELNVDAGDDVAVGDVICVVES